MTTLDVPVFIQDVRCVEKDMAILAHFTMGMGNVLQNLKYGVITDVAIVVVSIELNFEQIEDDGMAMVAK